MTHQIAVLIDGENISHRHFEKAFKQIKSLGEAAIIRIYGDWSRPNLMGWKPIISAYHINPVHQFQRRKNTIDFHLAMDAVDLFHRQPGIDHFCIVSSDSDFSALCLWLRDKGKVVTGYGEAKSSQEYMGCFNDFFVLDAGDLDKHHIAIRNIGRDIPKRKQEQLVNDIFPLRKGLRNA